MIVFMSYSRTDLEFAKRLSADLHTAGITVWIDHESLQPGTLDWQAAIRKGIEAAVAVVYVGSPDAANSVNVGSEVLIAQSKGRDIIAVWARGHAWAESAPFELMRTQYIDARDASYRSGAAQVLQALSSISSRSLSELAAIAVRQGTKLLGASQFESALVVFQQAVDHDPVNVDAWAGKGIALYGLGRIQEALAAAAQAQAALRQQ